MEQAEMTCPICNGSGLVPFIGKNGKVIPHVLQDCSCKTEDTGRCPSPDEIDFACSDTWRGYYYERYGEADPAYIPPVRQPEPEVIYRTRPSAELESIKGHILHLENKLIEHISRKPKQKPKEYGDISV